VSRGVEVRQVGHAIIRDEVHGESHLMTLPTMVIKNLMLGAPYPELTGTCYIVSSSGFLSTVVFEGKRTSIVGLGRNVSQRNSVRATLVNLREESRPLFQVTGQWNGALAVKDMRDGTGSVMEEFHVDKVAKIELQTKPVSEQSPWESRRAWFDVAAGIREGDLQKVGAAKTDIEEGQRAIRRAEQQANVEWPHMFFRKTNRDDEYDVLAGAIPDPAMRPLRCDLTAGVWKFVGVRAADALLRQTGTFHRGLAPTGQLVMDDSSSFDEKDEVATPLSSSAESLSIGEQKPHHATLSIRSSFSGESQTF